MSIYGLHHVSTYWKLLTFLNFTSLGRAAVDLTKKCDFRWRHSTRFHPLSGFREFATGRPPIGSHSAGPVRPSAGPARPGPIGAHLDQLFAAGLGRTSRDTCGLVAATEQGEGRLV